MYEIAVLGTVVLMLVSATDYVRRAWIGTSQPVPATWILMMVVMGLSCFMYWDSPKRSFTANIGVTAGVVNIAIILTGVIAANIHHGTLKVAFDRTQKWCLVAGAGVTIFWLFTKQPLIAYTLVQCIALIAYFATVKKLLKAKRSTEPIFIWAVVLCANLCALYPAWVKNDLFSWIYLARAVPSSALVLYLILRIKRRMRLS
ncbi:MAG: hypothetical protein WC465_03875 [Patescibacteria group bacterium]